MRRSTRMQLAKAAREQGGMMRMGGYEAENRGGRSEMEMGYGGGRFEMEMRRGGGRGARSEMEMGYGGDMGMEMRRGGGRGARSEMEMGYGRDMGMEMRRGGGRGNSGGRGRGGARSEMDMEMEMGGYGAESRFRDRRGREHYDNGRFAPMRGSYAPMGPYGGEDDGPFGRSEGGAEMREIGFNANWGGDMRMGSDASVPRFNEMEYMPGGGMMGGYMAEHQNRKLDEQTAMEWVRGMKNEDGSKSPHWTMDQVKQVVKQKGLDKEIEVVDMFAILNALYSDYDPIFKKHGVSNMDFYVDMAKAWIKDKDAVPNKAMAYYECIVK